jgi:hypothetical protein
MDADTLIAPSGMLAFALFAFACFNGFARFKLFKYHARTAYLCCAVIIAHGIFSLMCSIVEPLGVLAAAFMFACALSGFFHAKMKIHISLAALAMIFSIAHVAFILAH